MRCRLALHGGDFHAAVGHARRAVGHLQVADVWPGYQATFRVNEAYALLAPAPSTRRWPALSHQRTACRATSARACAAWAIWRRCRPPTGAARERRVHGALTDARVACASSNGRACCRCSRSMWRDCSRARSPAASRPTGSRRSARAAAGAAGRTAGVALAGEGAQPRRVAGDDRVRPAARRFGDPRKAASKPLELLRSLAGRGTSRCRSTWSRRFSGPATAGRVGRRRSTSRRRGCAACSAAIRRYRSATGASVSASSASGAPSRRCTTAWLKAKPVRSTAL